MRSRRFNEPPRGFNSAAFEEMLRERMPDRVGVLLSVARRSIRLWPRPASRDAHESRFGGLPAVPNGFDWPTAHDEPMLFLAQINCAEIKNQVEAPELPEVGLLSFFGDRDEVNGCGPDGCGAVLYFPKADELSLALPPTEDFELLISCGMSAYESYELPHPFEQTLAALNFSEKEWSDYIDLRLEVAAVPLEAKPSEMEEIQKLMSCWYETSKLFGWPDLIQYAWPGQIGRGAWHTSRNNFRLRDTDCSHRLLLQIGAYHDGIDSNGWGPGGLVYFVIENKDLGARRFERAELVVQCS